jgi:hypothetical protein
MSGASGADPDAGSLGRAGARRDRGIAADRDEPGEILADLEQAKLAGAEIQAEALPVSVTECAAAAEGGPAYPDVVERWAGPAAGRRTESPLEDEAQSVHPVLNEAGAEELPEAAEQGNLEPPMPEQVREA